MITTVSLPQLAGTAAGTVTSGAPLSAELLAVQVAANAAGTLTLTAGGPPAQTLFTLAGTAVGGGTAWYYPRAQVCSAAGVAVSGVYEPMVVDGYVSAVFNAGGTVSVTMVVEK